VTRCSPIAACATAALLLFPALSHATLGGKPTHVASNAPAQLLLRSAAQPAASNPPWSLHSMRGDDGVTVHEYASPDGVVFAVTWSGPVRPDMAALLGSYFANVASAARRGRRGTGPLVERNGDLQIESIGHQGQFTGKAWLPRLVPARVDMGDLE
jgi:hypothetical protein